MPTFEINVCVKFDTRRKKKSRKFFPLSQVKFFANVILKCRQFFYLESEIFSFVFSQTLRKRYSQISAFFLSQVGNVFLCLESIVTQTLFSNIGNFLSQVGNVFLHLKSRRRKKFRTQDKKNCRCLRITFA